MSATTLSADRSSTVGADRPLRTLILIGSTRAERFGPVPAAWITDQARRRPDLDVDVADLAELELPTVLPGNDPAVELPAPVAALGERIEAADAVIVVTPVYNRGYPASLKNAIDWFHAEWHATPVGFVSYGGRTGGIEAVEQLRTVFVELDTMTIRNVLTFPDFWTAFDDAGTPHATEATDAAAAAFLEQLTWWAGALRAARKAPAR